MSRSVLGNTELLLVHLATPKQRNSFFMAPTSQPQHTWKTTITWQRRTRRNSLSKSHQTGLDICLTIVEKKGQCSHWIYHSLHVSNFIIWLYEGSSYFEILIQAHDFNITSQAIHVNFFFISSHITNKSK